MGAIVLRVRVLLVVFLGIIVLGTIGFSLIEDRPLQDALYFTIVTVATVGYGDIHPATQAGRAFAVVLIVLGVGTFLGVVANATELMLSRREKRLRLEKTHTLIGAFFSEIGTELLSLLSDADADSETIRNELIVTNRWTVQDYGRLRDRLKTYPAGIDIGRLDLGDLSGRLLRVRPFLLRLLENPSVLEHESFTDLLWAVFHLTEELAFRKDFAALPDSDLAHLAGDASRAYGHLLTQWIFYMRHLQERYPYLFSLAVRTNPFDRTATPIVS